MPSFLGALCGSLLTCYGGASSTAKPSGPGCNPRARNAPCQFISQLEVCHRNQKAEWRDEHIEIDSLVEGMRAAQCRKETVAHPEVEVHTQERASGSCRCGGKDLDHSQPLPGFSCLR